MELTKSLYTVMKLINSLYIVIKLIKSVYTAIKFIKSLFTVIKLLKPQYTVIKLQSSPNEIHSCNVFPARAATSIDHNSTCPFVWRGCQDQFRT